MAQVDSLESLFTEAAAAREVPSPELVARILADAEVAQPKPAQVLVKSPSPRGWVVSLADWFGGGLSLAGMSAAAAMGLYLGVAQPASVQALAELVTGTTTIDSLDLLPANGTLWAQE